MRWIIKMNSAKPGRIAPLGKDTRGATIVEFGIILVPMCVVMLGALDLGYQSYVRAIAQGVLDDVARTASVEDPEFQATGDTLEERVENALTERLESITVAPTYDIEQTNYYRFAGVGSSEKLITDRNRNGRYDAGDCFEDLNDNERFDVNAGRPGVGGADDVVFHEVNIEMPRLLPMMGFLGVPDTYVVTARAAIRNQPWTAQGVPATVCV